LRKNPVNGESKRIVVEDFTPSWVALAECNVIGITVLSKIQDTMNLVMYPESVKHAIIVGTPGMILNMMQPSLLPCLINQN
jgi:hypothetical protein